MAFSDIKLEPNIKVKNKLGDVVFNRVRSSSEHKTLRRRECYCCGIKIPKGSQYINHQFKYDSRIITVSFCLTCFN